jgi:hypothetical protein
MSPYPRPVEPALSKGRLDILWVCNVSRQWNLNDLAERVGLGRSVVGCLCLLFLFVHLWLDGVKEMGLRGPETSSEDTEWDNRKINTLR